MTLISFSFSRMMCSFYNVVIRLRDTTDKRRQSVGGGPGGWPLVYHYSVSAQLLQPKRAPLVVRGPSQTSDFCRCDN